MDVKNVCGGQEFGVVLNSTCGRRVTRRGEYIRPFCAYPIDSSQSPYNIHRYIPTYVDSACGYNYSCSCLRFWVSCARLFGYYTECAGTVLEAL